MIYRYFLLSFVLLWIKYYNSNSSNTISNLIVINILYNSSLLLLLLLLLWITYCNSNTSNTIINVIVINNCIIFLYYY